MEQIETAGDSVSSELFYDQHPSYIAKRDSASPEYARWREEMLQWKIPNLLGQIPERLHFDTICEVGCATGELLCLLPVDVPMARRTGFDISSQNIKVARQRFPEASFFAQDIFTYSDSTFDLVILSDVLEHVPDDASFLRRTAELGRYVLLNLPLEKCFVYRNRRYGPQDYAGHLRAYSLQDGLRLIRRAELKCRSAMVRWFVDLPLYRAHRRAKYFSDTTPRSLIRALKFYLLEVVLLSKAFRHWYFPANLFAFLEKCK